jgi:hypothetical protein
MTSRMQRRFGIPLAGLLLVLLVIPAAGEAQSDLPTAQATEFLGNWTMTIQSDFGPMTLTMDIRDADGRVAVDVGTDMGRESVTDVTRREEALVLQFDTDAEGQPIDVLINLQPADNGLRAAVTAAGGMFAFTTTATRAQ